MKESNRTWVGIGLVTAVIGVLVLSGLAGAVPASNAGANSTNFTPTNVAGPSATVSAHGLPTPIKHVFLIMMENEQTSVIYGPAPYETKLANSYAWGGDANTNHGVGYYAVCHPSAPNYLALTSGMELQCGSDSYNSYNVSNLGSLLDTANDSWIAYAEGANVSCQLYNSGEYVVRHNPFTFYSNLGGNTSGSACMTHDVPIANLTNDYPYNATPPAFTFVAPNVLDDGHSSSAAYGDSWLSTFIPKLIAAPWFSSSVIFITYDEAYLHDGAYNSTGYDGLHGGPVYTVAVSPYTVGMGALDTNSSHYNELTTIEWLLGLPRTGTGLDGTPNFPAMTGLFQPRIFGPGVDLEHVNLQGTNLSGYDLSGDNLKYANLAGIDLSGADLRGADLQFVNLQGADLQGANLRGADLAHADLAFAVLTGLGSSAGLETNFDGASLFHAYLGSAVCGTPNDIVAVGANTNATAVPAACTPPL
jgi:hypothetical protein